MPRLLSYGSLALAGLLAGCVHPGRGPASVSAQDWKMDGPCAILNANFPLDTRNSPGNREAFVAIDPATQTRFMTTDVEGCRRMKYKVSQRKVGDVEESEATSECRVYGGEIVSKIKLDGLQKVYRWTDPKTHMSFNALEDARCKYQGFTRDLDPLGYGNP